MSAEIWSWIAAGFSVIGLWVSGQNPKAGWVYGIACQGLWVAYGLSTDQPGMIALSFAFVTLYSRNLRRWRNTPFRLQRRQAASAPAQVTS